MASKVFVFAAIACLQMAAATQRQGSTMTMTMNPIRKVVTLLQKMQQKVKEEGEKEKELYEKFMCYCKGSTKDLEDSIEAAEGKIDDLSASIKASEEELVAVKEKLKEDKASRASAEKTVAESTAQREKEKQEFDAAKSEYDANIDAVERATVAIEKGMAGAFLQTRTAQILKKLVPTFQDFANSDRQAIMAFLSGSSSDEYAPASGQIVGILKTMGDEMKAGLADAVASEKNSIKEYNALMKAKKKEIKSLTKSIEEKLKKEGELGVFIASAKNDLEDTEEGLTGDKAFLKDLLKNCATKTGEYEEHCKIRSQELLALADTIKILNDDDALELFKKTLPAPSASFMQVTRTSKAMRMSARAVIEEAIAKAKPADRVRLDFISLALHGKKIGFEKVIKMIDELMQTLKKEQQEDDNKKDYCEEQFDISDDKKKSLERSVADEKTAIADTSESLATTKDEIKKLNADITALDKMVMEATVQRQDENKAFKTLMAEDSAAKELLGFAKNRLNKFYNPKLYKPPAKKELSAEDRIVEQVGGSSLAQGSAAPPPPPPTAAKEYSKKSGESAGVIQMINLLITDLEKEMTEAKTEEKDAQADYETMMKDSAEKRAELSKTLTDKLTAKGDLEEALEEHTDALKSFSKELKTTNEYIGQLHGECDWLLQYFDVRKEARASEIDALGKAKAVLSGADYSLLQARTVHRGYLRRHTH